MKKANRIITVLIFVFLYIPMAVLIAASFNTGKDITHFEGYRVYQRTISFIVHKAVRDLYGDRKFYIRHTVGRGFYCEFADEKELSESEIETLRTQMQKIIDARYPIHRHHLLTADINGIYDNNRYPVVLAGGDYKEVAATDEGISALVKELVDDHTIG